jgi:hypothetical protein
VHARVLFLRQSPQGVGRARVRRSTVLYTRYIDLATQWNRIAFAKANSLHVATS